MSAQEQKNKRIGLLATIVWHGALLLFFLMFMAWTEPDPPIPEYGIEFNLGTSEISDVQSTETESIDEAEEIQDSPVEDETPVAGEEESSQEEIVEEIVDEVVESTPVETQSEPVETVDDTSPDTREELPVVDKVDDATEEEETEEAATAQKTEEQPEQVEEQKEEAKTPKIDDRAIYKGKSDKTPAGNQGASLDFSGWEWDFAPEPNDQSEESGKVVFEVTVDEEGEILSVRKIESNLSPIVEKVYRDAVMELTFSRDAENRSVAPTSKGKITFIIQSN